MLVCAMLPETARGYPRRLYYQQRCFGNHRAIILATGLEPRGSPKAAQEQPKGSPGAALGAAQGKPNGSPRASSLLHPVKHSETNKKSKKQHFCTTWTQDETSTRMICSFHPGMQRSHPKGQDDCRMIILISTSSLPDNSG